MHVISLEINSAVKRYLFAQFSYKMELHAYIHVKDFFYSEKDVMFGVFGSFTHCFMRFLRII